MDYESKYKNALKWARGIYPNAVGADKEDLEHLFPELAESEDERIRKQLIHYFETLKPYVPQVKYYFGGEFGISDILAWLEKQSEPIDKGEISDGYHTFNELYYYRMLYNAAFFNLLPREWVHKSKRHHDGEECFGGGWFIVIANLPTGQISNHYELKYWDLFRIPEKEVADEWDGHTPQVAAERLHKYLEKQGEKIPVIDFKAKDWYVSNVDGKIHNIYHSVDNVKPKFKVGDWCIDTQDGTKFQIVKVLDNTYTYRTNEGKAYSCTHNSLENDAKLWSITDARDGDVLTSIGFYSNCTFIFKGLDNWKFDEPNGDRAVATGYCCLSASADKMEFGTQGPDCIEVDTVKPATKIQRDLLFTKMHEAGYGWDAGNKKLRKIEQNIDWTEEDDYKVKGIIKCLHEFFYDCDINLPELHDYETWLKSLKQRLGGEE